MLRRGVLLLLLFVWSRSCAGLVHGRGGGPCMRPHVHRPGSDRTVPDRRVPDALSEHMRTLYAKYARPGHAFKDGNTVRSFTARCGSLGSRRLQIFNLTSLRSSESVLSATLHFFTGDVGHRGPLGHMTNHTAVHMPRGPLQLHVWSSASASGRALGHVRFDLSHARARGGAWQWRDVTQLVQAAAQSRGEERGAELLIGVQLEWRNIPRELKWPPYILLYANDSAIAEPESVVHSLLQRPGQDQDQDQDQDQNQEHHYEQNQLQNLDQDQNHSLRRHHLSATETVLQNQLQNLDQDQNPSLQRHHLPAMETVLQNQLQNKTRSPSRHRRSVNLLSPLQNNELPEREYPVGAGQEEYPYDPTNWAEQSPNRHTDQDSPKQPGPPRRAKKRKIRKEGKDTGVLLRFDERTLKKARRKWAEPRGCARRYLKVDFADIGWSDWIISPKAYDAFYCSGACGFPMSKTLKPSNHATIQSIVRAVGVVPGVPEPCCVPEKMSSLSILFFDEQANVVLKVYPNMSVDSCACR